MGHVPKECYEKEEIDLRSKIIRKFVIEIIMIQWKSMRLIQMINVNLSLDHTSMFLRFLCNCINIYKNEANV